MKNIKLVLLSVLFVACCFTSCTNNEPIIEEQNIEDSISITTSLEQLRTQFNNQGNVIPTENPSGNIVFDFCFDFVYPLNLSYNNGTTVTVNNLGNLVEVMINSTDNLFINGIEFPFNVEVYSNTENAIVVTTINNEEEFMSLIESCDFDNTNSCECYEVYDPVCVDVTAPNGVTFLVTYPNACYAECDGFTEADFVDGCEGNYNWSGENDCFTFNFPIDIITDTDETITINSQEELNNALYNTYYFEFIYSFDVTFNDGTVLSIGNEEAFIALLENCFDDGSCPCPANVDPVCVEVTSPNGGTEIMTFLNSCEAECAGFTANDLINCDFECTIEVVHALLLECSWSVTSNNTQLNYLFNENGIITITDENSTFETTVTWIVTTGNTGLPTLIINEEFNEFEDEWIFINCDENDLQVVSTVNPNLIINPDCDGNNPTNCSQEDITAYLQECVWYFITSLYQNVAPEYFIFNADGSLTVINAVTDVAVAVGTWTTSQNPITNQIVLSFDFDVEPYSLIGALDWTIVVCSENSIGLESGNEFLNLERDCN